MKYELFLEMKCFSRKELAARVGNLRTADSLIYSYKKKGLLLPVKKNLYVVKSMETGAPVLSPYEIACHLSPTACISNHSFFELNGMQNQVFNEIYVASDTPFKDVRFDGKTFKRVPLNFSDGVERSGNHLRFTNLERSFVDSLKNLDRIAGLEELFNNILRVDGMDFGKVEAYLQLYDSRFLYQKAGFVLGRFKDALNVPAPILDLCKKESGRSVRYLECGPKTKRKAYVKEWKLYVPKSMAEGYLGN